MDVEIIGYHQDGMKQRTALGAAAVTPGEVLFEESLLRAARGRCSVVAAVPGYKNVMHFRITRPAGPVSCRYMHTVDRHRLGRLEEGQLWKHEHGYVCIVELGERLIRYRMLRRPEAGEGMPQLIRLEALLNYLKQTEAELVCRDETARVLGSACAA